MARATRKLPVRGRQGRIPAPAHGMETRRTCPMTLTPEQLKDFDELGYLFLPHCFSEEEVAVLRQEAENIYKTDRKEVWREKSGAPRTAFAAHTYNEAFRL